MPFTAATFANVAGASSAATGQIVQSAVWNNIHIDYSTAFTQIMSQIVANLTNRNICWMNGGFEVWQRGAGSASNIAIAASTTSYTADRWYLTTGANQVSSVFTVPGIGNYSILAAVVRRDAGQTGTTVMTFGYPLDTDEIVRMRGNKVTLSFLIRTGADWSPVNGTLTVALYVGTGAVAKRGAGFTSETTVLSVSTNLAVNAPTTSISATSSAVLPTTATQAEIQFTWAPVGTAGATDRFTLDNLQIESNLTTTTWTPMNFDTISFSQMLGGCKRFYTKTFPYSVAPAAGAGLSNSLEIMAQAIARVGIWWQYPVEMRDNPSFSKYNPATATSSFFYTLATVSGASGSLTSSIDTQWGTNATKGILIYAATAAVDQLLFLQLEASAGI